MKVSLKSDLELTHYNYCCVQIQTIFGAIYSRSQNIVPIAKRLPSDFTAEMNGSFTVKCFTVKLLANSPVKRLLK